MADSRFFQTLDPLSLADIVKLADSELPADADPELMIKGAAPLHVAGASDLTFYNQRKYLNALQESRAAVCLVPKTFSEDGPFNTILLRTADPQAAYAIIAARFYKPFETEIGCHDTAFVHSTATLGEGVVVGAGAVVSADVEIGARTTIGPLACIDRGVTIGRDCRIAAQVAISHSLIGDQVVIHPGVKIGQDGFGYVFRPEGHLRVPQIGRVIIQDRVEIGANSTVDRGAGDDTVIGEGTKIDNLVQIGHNSRIGRHCIIVSQAGTSGSATLGDNVVLGGQVGVSDHVRIGNGAQIAAMSGVSRDVPDGAQYGGYPARPIAEWRRQVGALGLMGKRRNRGKPSS